MSEVDASHIRITPEGTYAQVHFRHTDYTLHVRSIGAFHIINMLPLYALADILSVSVDQIEDYALRAQSEPGRSSILK